MRDRFLRACRREAVDRTPDLAVEATLQPVRRFGVDAAILFSDLLLPLEPLGIPFEFQAGEGPVILKPVRTASDVAALHRFEPRQELQPVLQAIRLLRRELEGGVPLIGFAGAPFTLASYAIEGGHSTAFALTKALMYGDPPTWHRLAGLLAEVVGDYLRAQVEAGAQALRSSIPGWVSWTSGITGSSPCRTCARSSRPSAGAACP